MVAGTALRLRNYDESGMPELVKVKADTARRCEFVREQWLTDEEYHEHFCAVFKDKKTGRWYGQLAYDEADEGEEHGDGD